jgi:transposase
VQLLRHRLDYAGWKERTALAAALRPISTALDDELATADDQFAKRVAADPIATRLMTLPSIGPITASAFIAALEDAARFDGAAQVTSYRGLVPREYSAGEHQHRGRILRSAHPHVQSLLIQAAWRMSRSSDAKTAGLRAWANAITHRRGKKVAMVALARRLARILFAMWRDETAYQAKRVRVISGTAPTIVDATATVM